MCLYFSPIKKLLINRWIENLLNIYLGIPFLSCFGFKDKILVPYYPFSGVLPYWSSYYAAMHVLYRRVDTCIHVYICIFLICTRFFLLLLLNQVVIEFKILI